MYRRRPPVTSPDTERLEHKQGSRTLVVAQYVRHPYARNIIVLTFLMLVFRQAVAAPIRAFVPLLWYIPDLVTAAALCCCIYIGLYKKIVPMLVVLAFFALFFMLSLLQNPLESVALSTRQVFYLAIAISAGYIGQRGRQFVATALAAIAVIAIVGVIYDYLFVVPWRGMLFSGALQTKAVAREWWSSGGQRRLAGFGLSSADTSVIIACGVIFLSAVQDARTRLFFYLLYGPAVWAMLATTQKATCAAFIFVTAIALATRFSLGGDRDGAKAGAIYKIVAVVAIIAAVLAPIALYQMDLGSLAAKAPTLNQRINEVWPAVIERLLSSPASLWGYGFGAGADTATIPAFALVDNVFLFSVINFGLVVTALVFYWSCFAIVRLKIDDLEALGGMGVIALLTINGITANVVASGGLGSLLLGFAIGLVSRPKPNAKRMSRLRAIDVTGRPQQVSRSVKR